MANLEKNIIPLIESVYEQLTTIEKIIADYFLDCKSDEDLSAQRIADKLHVSMPSLTRFAKKCGFSGYRQFIYAFQESNLESSNISRDLTKKVLSDYGELLNKSFSLIDEEQFLRIGQLLDEAKRVYIYGQGSSGLAAREIAFRFMRLGMVCQAITDSHIIQMNHVMVDATCLVVGISISGESRVIVDAVFTAKTADARTVFITANQTKKLQESCHELVLVPVKKHLEQGNHISPQFPILLVVDIFYAYYMSLDKASKKEIFNHTLSALEQGF